MNWTPLFKPGLFKGQVCLRCEAQGIRKEELRKIYKIESRSIREIAEIQCCSKDMVYRALMKYGIEVRPNRRRSKLKNIKMRKQIFFAINILDVNEIRSVYC